MALTAEQVKGRIKNLAKQNGADARVLVRLYMMERFLERVSVSQYAGNFVIKGGILVTSMVGIAMRSTMDIDASIRNRDLSEEDARRIVDEVAAINLDDDIRFQINDVSGIMDEMEYPGIRITMDAIMGKMVTPIKIDISTGDIITPRAVCATVLFLRTAPDLKGRLLIPFMNLQILAEILFSISCPFLQQGPGALHYWE